MIHDALVSKLLLTMVTLQVIQLVNLRKNVVFFDNVVGRFNPDQVHPEVIRHKTLQTWTNWNCTSEHSELWIEMYILDIIYR